MDFPDPTHLEPPTTGPMPSIGPVRRSALRRAARALGVVLACSALAASTPLGAEERHRRRGDAAARDLGLRASFGVLQVETTLRLDAVRPGELFAGPRARAIAEPSWRPDLGAGALRLDTHVVRTIPAVWRMRVEDPAEAAALSVRCEIATDSGRTGVLSHVQDPHSIIHVWVRPLASPSVTAGAGEALIEGGVVLEMDVRDVRTAGLHSGTLTVTVEHY
jgi:hypothetical protein